MISMTVLRYISSIECFPLFFRNAQWNNFITPREPKPNSLFELQTLFNLIPTDSIVSRDYFKIFTSVDN